MIDEKEDIISERDAYKCKAHRLNHALLNALKANKAHPKFLDIDAILLENKYLHERLKNFESELDITKQSLTNCKVEINHKIFINLQPKIHGDISKNVVLLKN